MRQIELLIPARNLEAGTAAVDHGADAVYIGGPGFGARAAAGNPVEDIARLAAYAHPYGVKVYAALNTLVYEHELRQAETAARELLEAGVDALIIQDPSYLMMGLDGAVFHASTQMCNTTPEKVEFLARSGFARVVLERGLTLDEVRQINSLCNVETECFVHGAICVGHSGQCYLSRSIGPRSGNRGECSQPCRLCYDLEDDRGKVLIKNKHLLSVRDLNLSVKIGDMVEAGVTSFKVEGRLKEVEYVRNITSFYRSLLDREIAARPDVVRSSAGGSRCDFTPDPVKSFSRGFTDWTAGGKKAGSASFDTPKSLGEPVGTVKTVRDGYFIVDTDRTLSPGDGICFMSGGELTGTNINKVEGTKVYPDKMQGISAGTGIFRNYDHKFSQALARSRTRRSVPVNIQCRFAGGGLRAVMSDNYGNSIEGFLPGTGETASDPERMCAAIQAQMQKTGDTIYEVGEFSLEPSGGDIPFYPVSALNAFRRELTEKLTAERLRSFLTEREIHRAGIPREEAFPYPDKHLGAEGNVTNSLSEKFWRNHGVESFDKAYDLRHSLDGETVMTTPYCLLRELGQCLRGKPQSLHPTLYLRTGNNRYRLIFDCKNCLMKLQKCRH